MIYSRSTLNLGQDLKDACSSSTEEGAMDCMEHRQQALCKLNMCSEGFPIAHHGVAKVLAALSGAVGELAKM